MIFFHLLWQIILGFAAFLQAAAVPTLVTFLIYAVAKASESKS